MEIEERAHIVLTRYWEAKGKPEISSFFPVDARDVIRTVMGWECEERDLVEVDTRPGYSVLGRCVIYGDGRRVVQVATQEPGSGLL